SRTPGDERYARSVRIEMRERNGVFRQGDRIEVAVFVEKSEPVLAGIADGDGDPSVVEERIRREAENPLRHAELRLGRMERDWLAVFDTIEVPPAGAVGDDMEFSVGTPLRLKDGFVVTTTNPGFVR